MSKKVLYKVYSIRDYRSGADDVVTTNVRVDMFSYDGPAFALMDSSVYEIDDFMDIHQAYKAAAQACPKDAIVRFEYEYDVYARYIDRIKRELAAMA